MKCYECKKECSHNHGALSMHDEFIGGYIVNDVDFHKCDSCHEHFFPPETLERIDDCRETALRDLILSHSLSSFMKQSDTWKFLGVSRQAFHKNIRIKNGFIYNASLGKNRYYLRESVELFKQTGDGRFKLNDTSSDYLLDVANTIFESSGVTYFEEQELKTSPEYTEITL